MWIIQTPLRTAFHDTQRLLLEVYISNVRSVFVFFAPLMKKWVKCIFKFYLARVNSIPVEFTSAWIFPSSFYKILLQMIPCLCRRRIK